MGIQLLLLIRYPPPSELGSMTPHKMGSSSVNEYCLLELLKNADYYFLVMISQNVPHAPLLEVGMTKIPEDHVRQEA